MTDLSPAIRVANAPVTFGIFELAAAGPPFIDGDDLMGQLAAAGYEGVDLGPPGYLGGVSEIGARLLAHGLGLAGGWVALRFTDPAGFSQDLGALESALDVFLAGTRDGYPAPRPTLADAGSALRQANPGRGADLPEIRVADADWPGFAGRVQTAVDRVRARGLEPTFHHHACTYVEAPVEIERLLDLTDVGLCLDTGHLLLGGGDPLDAWHRWRSRINHLHLKDCHLDVLRDCIREGAPMREVWSRGVFCALGEGDLDLDGLLAAITGSAYHGWLVVEQDLIPGASTRPGDLVAEQTRNREVLRRHGI